MIRFSDMLFLHISLFTQIGYVNYRGGLLTGQKNLIAGVRCVARSLINDPKVILADEPTGNLDSENGKAIIDLLISLSGKGKTIVIVTHDPRIGIAVKNSPRGRNI